MDVIKLLFKQAPERQRCAAAAVPPTACICTLPSPPAHEHTPSPPPAACRTYNIAHLDPSAASTTYAYRARGGAGTSGSDDQADQVIESLRGLFGAR
jgi:hypothetical protein